MSQEPRQTSDLSARRRLLRGAFAVPAVMTVVSGRALAQTSSAALCIAKQVKAPITGNVTESYDATARDLVRVQLYGLVHNGSGGNIDSYWLRGGDLPVNGGRAFILDGQYQRFDLARNRLVADTLVSDKPSKSAHKFEPVPKFVALRFDSTGIVTGVGLTGDPYYSSAVYHSCWNSFT